MADPEIPDAAIKAGAEALLRQYEEIEADYTLTADAFTDEARAVLVAAWPHLNETRFPLRTIHAEVGAAKHARLDALVGRGAHVRVTNPRFPDAPWEGDLIGLADHPTLILKLPDGGRRTLPQRFDVEEIDGDDT